MKGELIHVVIPAHNEEHSVGSVVEGLKKNGLNLRIIVIDDGSMDGTADRARAAGALVARHPLNLGQWGALKTGFKLALMDKAKIIMTLDADGQHLPEEMKTIIDPIRSGRADFTVGTRFSKGDPEMMAHRSLGIKFFNMIMKVRTGIVFTDCTCGYKAYKAEVLASILPQLNENQYGALESLIKIVQKGYVMEEIPIAAIPSQRSSKGRLRYGYNLIRTILLSLDSI